MRLPFLLSLLITLLASTALAEDPITTHNQSIWAGTKSILLRAATTMPEEKYGFKPVDSVRTFGQIVGHVADSQYAFCSSAIGEKNPALKIEKTKTTKAELVAALKDAFAYCDRAFAGMTDASAAALVPFHGSDAPKIGVMTVNEVHTIEHYGNLVTYMRMNGLVPPTSDPEFMKELMSR